MKKIYTIAAAMLLTSAAFAQFFVPTTYKGAFGPAATAADWTSGWANWDPENTNYPTTTTTVSSDITTNTTWTTGTVVKLENKVYVTNNATLTIQPGVIIRGDKATEATLIITKGAKIMAQGTAANPIVFTSNFSVTDGRNPGDWGGVIILGNGINNQGSSVVEGGLDAIKAAYGGSTANDNSGVFQFVRIEFAGFPFQPDKEINGLTFGAVGSATTVDHIQVSFSNDDSYEFFGGSVNCKYLIAYRGIDDDFDTDFGFSGKVQFGLIIRDPNLADQCACSTSEGFESDNDAAGSYLKPKTSAVFSNITLVGPYRGSTSNTIDAKFKRALRIRKNSGISVFNSVFTDFPAGLHFDGSAVEKNATYDTLAFKNNVLAGMATGKNLQLNAGSTFDIKSFFGSNNNDSLATTAGLFVTPYPVNFLNPDYRLPVGSALLTGANFNHAKLDTIVGNPVGIESINKSVVGITLYPNPASDNVSLNISLKSNSTVAVEVFDVTGKLVLNSERANYQSGNHLINMDASSLTRGIYLVKVLTNLEVKTLKLSVIK